MPSPLLLVLAAAVGCGRMARREPGLAENLVPQRPWRICPLHEAACLQHWDHPLDKIHKRPWRHGVHQVKAVDAGLKPLLQRIGDLLWRADLGAVAARRRQREVELAQRQSVGLEVGNQLEPALVELGIGR